MLSLHRLFTQPPVLSEVTAPLPWAFLFSTLRPPRFIFFFLSFVRFLTLFALSFSPPLMAFVLHPQNWTVESTPPPSFPPAFSSYRPSRFLAFFLCLFADVKAEKEPNCTPYFVFSRFSSPCFSPICFLEVLYCSLNFHVWSVAKSDLSPHFVVTFLFVHDWFDACLDSLLMN